MANEEVKMIVGIEISSKCAICIDCIDLNEPFAVPPYGHVTHLDCMALHNIIMIGVRRGYPTCRAICQWSTQKEGKI